MRHLAVLGNEREALAAQPEAAAGEETPVDVTSYGEELSAGELLQLVEKLHKQFEDEVISFEDFEEQKAELMARLPVD